MGQFKFVVSFYFILFLIATTGCSRKEGAQLSEPLVKLAPLYAESGKEFKARFQAVYRTSYAKIEDISKVDVSDGIRYTTKFLFGPLTYRSLGGVQKGEKIFPHFDQAALDNGRVVIPYSYEGVWMIHSQKVLHQALSLPLPYAAEDLLHTNWLSCTDASDEDHATASFLWYFWDPTRSGCENKEGVDYQTIEIQFDEETEQTTNTFPEYDRMVHMENGQPVLAMTFAFGYVEDAQRPHPFKDRDAGMYQFQKFYEIVRRTLLPLNFKETSILQSEITSGSEKIGARFVGQINGVEFRVSVISNAGVDQMEIFAHSFAAKHEGFFGWFGHSRVGDGFDADNFKNMLRFNPKKFSMVDDYQLVYWAGCNSYSYYTLPFFDLKAKVSPAKDPRGTQNLDIISNTLPSLFAFNADNANVLFQSLIKKDQKTSYQKIIGQIESLARRTGYDVIVNVLGDEDNQ